MDPYVVLEVDKTATLEEIRISYQRLARIFHPDKNKDGTDSDRFIEIQQAWETLSSADAKAEYDRRVQIQSLKLVYETMPVDEVEHSSDGLIVRDCRCGEAYEVFRDELQSGKNYIPCSGCSLHIVINV